MKYSSNSILAFIPQSEEGKQILNQSLVFQNKFSKRIFIVDILKSASVFSRLLRAKTILKEQKQTIKNFHHFVKDTIGKDIPKEIILRTKAGNIVKTLIKESKKGGYEFIIIDNSKANFKGALSQSEVDKFISKSHCPVLTINKNVLFNQINTIVVPIDISDTTQKRLYWATLFAKKFHSKIQIVSVLNIDIEETKSLAFKNAEKIKKMILDRQIECDVKILKAHDNAKHKVLLDYIDKKHPELVIIRTHQEFQFTGKKIGKFISEIIHGCKMPVFTVGGSTENYPVDFN